MSIERKGNSLKVTALVLTYERSDWLERCLRSLFAAASRCESLELNFRVGINGEDSRAEEVLGRLKTTASTELITSVFPKVSPAAARNRLLREMDSDWVLFIDDDAYVEPWYFERFLRVIDSNPNASVIGGPNLTPPASGGFQAATGAVLASRFATFLSYARYRVQGSARACGEESLILCNLFVRSSVLGKDPFPEAFVCNEENWLLQQLSTPSQTFLHAPDIWLWHERRPTTMALARQVFRYGYGRAQHVRKRPASIHVAHFVPSVCLLYGVAVYPLWYWSGSQWLWWPFGAYGVLATFAAARALRSARLHLRLYPVALALYPLVHGAYGAGVIMGMLRRA